MKSNKSFSFTTSFSVAVLLLNGCQSSDNSKISPISKNDKKPNVIFIITDDQGYGDIASHGNPYIETPNIDKLYKESVRLTDFHVGTTSAPTRAGIMTGYDCNRVGVWHTVGGRSLMSTDYTAMPVYFKRAGYVTAVFGKWHLGDNYPFRPEDRGFDETLIHGGGGIGQTPDYWGNDYFDDTYFHNGVPEKYKGYCTDVWFENALQFIEQNKEHPFFCYLSPNAPHGPYHIDSTYMKPYLNHDSIPNPNFYGMIANIDENLGKLRQKLHDLDLTENTILVFMTDNGTSAGVDLDEDGWSVKGYNAGMRGKKGSEYEGGHRVPFFIRYKRAGIYGGKDIDVLTGYTDVLPTLLDLCNIELPENTSFDGISLKQLLLGNRKQLDERVLITDTQRDEYPEKWKRCAIMQDKWRLINGKKLYNIKNDPGQRLNVADSYPAIKEKLRTAYETWWNDIAMTFDRNNAIGIGADAENPVFITCHDWHSEQLPPWNQTHIRRAKIDNGYWIINVLKKANYEFNLRRWPAELNLAFSDTVSATNPVPGGVALPSGKPLFIQKACLQINTIDTTWQIKHTDTVAQVTIPLQKGIRLLRTGLIDNNGEERGAYYVEVKCLD